MFPGKFSATDAFLWEEKDSNGTVTENISLQCLVSVTCLWDGIWGFFHCGFSSTVAGSSHCVQQVYPSLIRFRKAEQIRYGGFPPLRQSESRRTNARNVNFTNSLRWPIFISARLTKPNYLFIKIHR